MACLGDFVKDTRLVLQPIKQFINCETYTIVDQYKGTKYNVCNPEMAQTFYTCISSAGSIPNACMHFSEVQYGKTTCLDIDIDIKQTHPHCQFENEYSAIVATIVSLLYELFNLEPFYVALLKRGTIEQKDTHYKDGMHIRVFLQMTYNERVYFMTKLKEEDIFRQYAFNKNLLNISDIIDLDALRAPVLVYGCNKRFHSPKNKLVPYTLHSVYKVSSAILIEHIVDPQFTNLCLEMSILFDGNVIKKPRAECKTEINEVCADVSQNLTDAIDLSDTATYVKHMLLNIYKPFRYIDYLPWFNVIRALAKGGFDKELAYAFSSQWEHYKSRNGKQKIQQIYTTFKSNDAGALLTLELFAKEDDEQAFAQLQLKRCDILLYEYSIDNNGDISAYTMANLIKHKYNGRILYQDKQWYIYNAGNGHWECDIHPKYPTLLYDYITEDMHRLIVRNIDYLHKYVKDACDDDTQSFISVILRGLHKSSKQVHKIPYISETIDHCTHKLSASGHRVIFDDRILTKYVIGVKNGVYDLQNKELLINCPELYVTRSTQAEYDPTLSVDGDNPYIVKLLSMIRDIIVEDDAREFIMCLLASSLDWEKKEPLFQIFYGFGKNGKSTLDELMRSTLGSVDSNGYAYKVQAAYFTNRKETTGCDAAKMGLEFSRYTSTSELEIGAQLHMPRIKEMSSDTMSGNQKFEKQKNFMVNSVFVLSTNVQPRIVNMDFGSYRRLSSYKFKTSFVDNPTKLNEKQCDSRLYNAILSDQQYRNAWLTILLYYYDIYVTKYGRKYSNIPAAVIKTETFNYLKEQNSLGVFIDRNVVKDKFEQIAVDVFYGRYSEWYKIHVSKHMPYSQSEIETELEKTHLYEHIIKNSRGYRYITQHRFITSEEMQSDTGDDDEILKYLATN